MPPLPEAQDAGAQASYELAVLRERILQAALYYTAALLVDIEVEGHRLSENTRRGQWVQFTMFALHAALREGMGSLPDVVGARLSAELLDNTLRRLAHELPDAGALPGALKDVLPQLHKDFAEASDFYLRMPVSRTDGSMKSGAMLLGRTLSKQVAPNNAESAAVLSDKVVQYAQEMLQGIDATGSWDQIGRSRPRHEIGPDA